MQLSVPALVLAILIPVTILGATSANAQSEPPEVRQNEIDEALRHAMASGATVPKEWQRGSAGFSECAAKAPFSRERRDGFGKRIRNDEPEPDRTKKGGRAAFDAGVIEPASPPEDVPLASAIQAPMPGATRASA